VPEAQLQQNATTMTIHMPGGLLSGVRLRTAGIHLICQRGSVQHDYWIRSDADLGDGLVEYLRHLPPY
jgi:hypothetical protein